MLDAIQEVRSFIKGKNRKTLDNDRKLILSLIKEIEMIGEAASKISEEFKKNYKYIPWKMIVAVRNRLIHGYFDIDYDIVWKTVTMDLPSLEKQLKRIDLSGWPMKKKDWQ